MARGAWHEEVDLVVVGASVGGLAAAVVAADRGCRTIVVERTKELGGGAANEAEMIAAAGSRWQRAAGIDDGPERLAADVLAATHHHVEPELAAALAAQGAPVVAWRSAGACCSPAAGSPATTRWSRSTARRSPRSRFRAARAPPAMASASGARPARRRGGSRASW